MYKKIDSTISILKDKGVIFGDDMTFIFNVVSKYSQNNNQYYKNSADHELIDFSLEYSGTGKTIGDVFRASYFGTDLKFLKEVFLQFGYEESLKLFLSYYKIYVPFLKDNFVTCGFKFIKGTLVELKVYFDVKKSKILLDKENIEQGLETINSEILLKSFTFNKNSCIEEKLYIPPDRESLKYAEKKLNNNDFYPQFKFSDYYDILYRYNGSLLESIKFYYNIRGDVFLRKIIDEKFSQHLSIDDFVGLNVMEEIGIDFNLNNGINKYNYYIGLYK